ncbi:hypothetical protein CNY89_14930 [Amaricoccus sp. HAR-UPW-R2A-40]|nr:hypothetical protein CNY89_14930 [Amaricoccus sp. HAR-UPW-R2A-40]
METTEEGTSQILALQWLVFDFGQRQAVAAAAKQGSRAANVLFNGAHQRLIFEVAQSYYLYGAASQRRVFAESALKNARRRAVLPEARLEGPRSPHPPGDRSQGPLGRAADRRLGPRRADGPRPGGGAGDPSLGRQPRRLGTARPDRHGP